ncbi:HWE histidine kinase domain-containing protein [Sphingomonas sp. H39-1-10]|uniref:sensor histidine kinase n=1 Tax=Sphingomonas pollutisoli TaxID=3030829 RepID=UPI0023BA3664|nr:HWE histidine kinase domain-containing protein [Sphingomonas pollutisoli]MDF0488809.1 HWE histidine kinase domain-containing protein [Sphingomonas pollutisoli]
MPATQEWRPEQLRRAITAAGVALWAWNVDTDAFTMDELGFELWGLPQRDEVTFEQLSARIHPADRDRVRSAFAATRAILGPYETDFRIMIGDEVRWVAARGQGEEDDAVAHTVYGIFLDVTGRKQAEEGHELLAGEMSHRVKNLLAIASGLTAISSRSAETVEQLASDLTERLSALGRAHDLVRPLPDGQGDAALLGDLIAVLLAPYDLGGFKGRIRVAVERMGVGEKAATALALVIHELATNAMKYGALSVPEGTLDVSSTSEGDDIVLTWLEHGGPEVHAPDDARGFGSKLVQRSVTHQLGGTITYDWAETGLIVTIRMNRARLAA